MTKIKGFFPTLRSELKLTKDQIDRVRDIKVAYLSSVKELKEKGEWLGDKNISKRKNYRIKRNSRIKLVLKSKFRKFIEFESNWSAK